MDLGTETTNGVLIANAGRRIDSFNARDFERAVRSAVGNHQGPVIVDCEDLANMSSAGLRVMLMNARTMQDRNEPSAVCSASGSIAKLFRVSGFDQVIFTHASRHEALSAIGG